MRCIIFILLLIISLNIVYADYYQENFTANPSYRSSMSNSDIDIQNLRYEPYPVNPGEYFTLWIKAENMGSTSTKNAIFELVPVFPFSLDSNEDPIRRYGELDARPVVLEYKIRVDKNAVEGPNEIKLKYNSDGTGFSIWVERTFNIEINDAQTDFDLVIQEVNNNDVTLAIANIGKNTANSVIVKIPNQDNFEVVGTSGQMVGNLEDGDYTLVSFKINEKRDSKNLLTLQIYYTDNIGERRNLTKEIKFGTTNTPPSFAGKEGTQAGHSSGRNGAKQSIYLKWWFWTLIVIIFFALWKGFKKYKRIAQRKEEKKVNKK